MDRELLLSHLRRTRFAPGDRARAQADARAIADYLKTEYGARVTGIGSAFVDSRPFRRTSDIDLVVEGLPDAAFFQASARAADMTDFSLDLIPLESATSLMRSRVAEEGYPVRPDEILARRLAAEIDAELATLRSLVAEHSAAPAGQDSFTLRARGSILHDVYTAVERIFVRIAEELNGGVPQGEQWHRQLLRDMTLELDGVRPAVITETLAAQLGAYLRFRHVFRNVYGSVLEAERMRSLEAGLADVAARFADEVRNFEGWLVGEGGGR